MPKAVKFQPFIREEVLVSIYRVCICLFSHPSVFILPCGLMLILAKINFPQDVFPSTVEQFFELLLKDGSNFVNEYRAIRKDTNLSVSTKILWSSYLHVFSSIVHSIGYALTQNDELKKLSPP